MKRCIALAMSAALALSITACGSSSKPSASQSGSASDASTVLGEDVQIPNPWKDFESLEEAVKAVGFDFVAPDALAAVGGHGGLSGRGYRGGPGPAPSAAPKRDGGPAGDDRAGDGGDGLPRRIRAGSGLFGGGGGTPPLCPTGGAVHGF